MSHDPNADAQVVDGFGEVSLDKLEEIRRLRDELARDPMLTEGQPIPKKPQELIEAEAEVERLNKAYTEALNIGTERWNEVQGLKAEVERLKEKYEKLDALGEKLLDKLAAHKKAMRECIDRIQDKGCSCVPTTFLLEPLRVQLEEK